MYLFHNLLFVCHLELQPLSYNVFFSPNIISTITRFQEQKILIGQVIKICCITVPVQTTTAPYTLSFDKIFEKNIEENTCTMGKHLLGTKNTDRTSNKNYFLYLRKHGYPNEQQCACMVTRLCYTTNTFYILISCLWYLYIFTSFKVINVGQCNLTLLMGQNPYVISNK